MGLLKRLLGRESDVPGQRARGSANPDQAVERYRYLLRTAPPETIEEAHAEAFAALTPEQRRQVLAELAAVTPANERPTSDDPETLARAATRAEMRQPGTLERSFGGAGINTGGMMAGALLFSVAGAYIGTSIAGAMYAEPTGDEAAATDYGAAGDGAAADGAGGDWGGGFDSGGFGGGDFGGGV